MKLFKIYQNINKGYDTYDSAVVIANSAEGSLARYETPTIQNAIKNSIIFS